MLTLPTDRYSPFPIPYSLFPVFLIPDPCRQYSPGSPAGRVFHLR
jgi:hypothetical protein